MMRGKTGISILHGDNMDLAEKMRRHQIFVEYVPLALITVVASIAAIQTSVDTLFL